MAGPEPEVYSGKPKDDKIGNGDVLNGRETSPVHQTNAKVTSSSSIEITSRSTVMASEVAGYQKDDEKLNGGASCKLDNF